MKKIYFIAALLISAFAAKAQTYPLFSIDSVQRVTLSQLQGDTTVSPFKGDTIRVRGLVIFNPRLNGLSTSWKATYIQDPNSSAPWKGLYIRLPRLADSTVTRFFDNCVPGNIVEVTGIVDDFGSLTTGETQLNLIPVQTTVIGLAAPRPPIVVEVEDFMRLDAASGSFVWNPTTGEQYEGMYVEFRNVQIVDIQNNVPASNRYAWRIMDSLGNRISIRDMSAYFRNDRGYNYISTSTLAGGGNSAAPIYLQQGKKFAYVRGVIVENAIAGIPQYSLAPLDTSDLGPVLATPPIITNIVESNPVPRAADPVVITADITDIDGTVIGATLHYAIGISSTNFTSINMSPSGSSYTAIIPAQPNGSFVKYYIKATDDDTNVSFANDSTGTGLFYTVRDNGITKIKELQESPYGGSSLYAGETISQNLNIKAVIVSSAQSYDLGLTTVEDESTPYSGIFVNAGPNNSFDTWKRGDSVLITQATIIESFGVTTLTDVTATLISSNPSYTATTIKLNIDSVLSRSFAFTEPYEGMLLEFNNVYVIDTNADFTTNRNFGEFSFYTDTTSGNRGLRADDISPDINSNGRTGFFGTDSLRTYQKLAYIRGVLTYSFGNWKILPRNRSDIAGYFTVMPVGLSELTQNEPFTIVSVAPNPAQDLVKIVLNKSGYGRLNISLTDITGRQVADYSQNIQEGTFQLELNTSTLSSGIYVLHMVTNGVAKTEKIVINK